MTQPVDDPSPASGPAEDSGLAEVSEPDDDMLALLRPRELNDDDAGDMYEPI